MGVPRLALGLRLVPRPTPELRPTAALRLLSRPTPRHRSERAKAVLRDFFALLAHPWEKEERRPGEGRLCAGVRERIGDISFSRKRAFEGMPTSKREKKERKGKEERFRRIRLFSVSLRAV